LVLVICLLKLKISYLYSFFYTIICIIKFSVLNIYLYINNEIKYKYTLNNEPTLNYNLSFENNNNISNSLLSEDKILKSEDNRDYFFE
jgi:hypothetical protein